MRNYQCQTCGEGILLEPAEVEEHGAYCTEHMFSEQFPALDRLADQVSTEEQRGPIRQEENRAATTETHQQEGSVMDQSTAPEAWGYAKKICDAKGNELYTLALRDKLRVTHPNNDFAANADSPVDFYLYTRNANGEELNRVFVNVKENDEFMGSMVVTKTSLVEFAEWVIGQFSEEPQEPEVAR